MQNTLKGLVVASGYLKDNLKDNCLVSTFEKIIWVRPIGNGPQTSENVAYRFTTKMAPGKRAQGPEENYIRMKPDANPGIVAAVLRHKIQETGQATFATMGAGTANRAMKAIILGETYLKDELQGKTLGVVVEMEKFRDQKRNTEVGRLLITCFPVAK